MRRPPPTAPPNAACSLARAAPLGRTPCSNFRSAHALPARTLSRLCGPLDSRTPAGPTPHRAANSTARCQRSSDQWNKALTPGAFASLQRQLGRLLWRRLPTREFGNGPSLIEAYSALRESTPRMAGFSELITVHGNCGAKDWLRFEEFQGSFLLKAPPPQPPPSTLDLSIDLISDNAALSDPVPRATPSPVQSSRATCRVAQQALASAAERLTAVAQHGTEGGTAADDTAIRTTVTVAATVTVTIKTDSTDASRRATLDTLLRSIRRHYGSAIAVLVADDGAMAAEMARSPPHGAAWLVLPHGTGAGAGRNALVHAVRTPFVLLCDDDVAFDNRTRIETLLAALSDRPRAAIAAGCYVDTERSADDAISDAVSCFTHQFSMRPGGALSMYASAPPNDDGGCVEVDAAHNFFLARAATLRAHTWDPRMRVGEHEAFFYGACRRSSSGARSLCLSADLLSIVSSLLLILLSANRGTRALDSRFCVQACTSTTSGSSRARA